MTFREFAHSLLGEDLYRDFLICSEYTDFENEDVYETLYNYGMEDNEDGWTCLSIPWKQLINTIASKTTIQFSCDVDRIEKTSSNFLLHVADGRVFESKKVVIATTIASVKKLLPTYQIYNQIHGQTFVRVYGKFSKSCIPRMKELVPNQTIVPGPLHRIISIDGEKGVYMIAYTDNESAQLFKYNLKNTAENREMFCRALETSLGIPENVLHLIAILDFYWPIGTHYYEPLQEPYKSREEFIYKAQHPMPGMLVVGEMISRHQGWTEGALESVEAISSEL